MGRCWQLASRPVEHSTGLFSRPCRRRFKTITLFKGFFCLHLVVCVVSCQELCDGVLQAPSHWLHGGTCAGRGPGSSGTALALLSDLIVEERGAGDGVAGCNRLVNAAQAVPKRF